MANIARWDPLEDSLFDIFPAFFGRPAMVRAGDMGMRMDVTETDREYRVSVEVPGVPKNSIQVSIDRNNLTISAERREEKTAGEDAGWILRERVIGKVSRSLALPNAVDESNSEARYVDGVLHLTLPKMASMKRLAIH